MPHGGEHEATSTGLRHRKLLMWAFLGSDCMFFGALIATYLVYQGKSLVGPFPEDVFSIPVTSVSTFVLLMSSMSMVLSYAALTRGNIKAYRIWLASTAILGFPGIRISRLCSTRIDTAHEPVRHHVFHAHRIPRRACHAGSDLVAVSPIPLLPKRRSQPRKRRGPGPCGPLLALR